AVIVCEPSSNGLSGVNDQFPFSSTVAVPNSVSPSRIVTVAPGSPVPVISGVGLPIVDPSPDEVTPGTGGATVPTVTDTSSDGPDTLHAALPSVAVIVCGPSSNGLSGVNDQLPFSSTVVVPNSVSPSRIVTVAPGSPVPVISGVLLPIVEPSSGDVITGGSGGSVSATVNVTGSEAGETASPADCTAWIVCSPGGNGVSGVSDQD